MRRGRGNIHDDVAHAIEVLACQWFSKEVSQIVYRLNEWNTYLQILDTFSHEEMAPVDMFCHRMKLRVVRQSYSRLVIHAHVHRGIVTVT